MMKSLSAMTHRADLSLGFFQNYYEETHAPLAIQLFPFSRYVRNHLLDAPDIDFTRAWQRPVFPARAVLWTPDSVALVDIPAELSAQVVRVRRCETPPEVLAAACSRHPG